MKKALLIASVLFIAVITTACINNIAVQELNNKANEFMQKGDYVAAMNRLEASIDLDSTMYETHYNLGIAATNAKQYEKAINAFENGIKLNPDYAEFYYSLGVAQYSYADELTEKKLAKEENSENKEIEQNEEDNITQTDSKYAIEELNNSAVKNLEKYLQLNPNTEEKENILSAIKKIEDDNKTEDVKE